MNNFLNEDSQAMLLICSNLAITTNEKDNIKPYTLTEWNKLAGKLFNSVLKSPKAFFHYSSEEWKDSLTLTDMEVERLKRLLNNGAQLAFELDRLNSSGIWVTTRAEATYPTLLKERLKHKCPIFLYCAGSSSLFKTKGIGIVGSRNIDEKALDFTKALSERCTLEGYTIISGGAKGVDSVAQNIALQNNGTVISIVSDSMASKIKSKDYREAIIKKDLLMISAVHPNMPFKAYNAMDRNKYIYTLSELSVAVSSDYNKGGTWAGATENLKNKWVPLFVRKETEIPKGNEELLKIGALPLEREELLNKNKSVLSWLNKENSISKEDKKEQIAMEQLFKRPLDSKIIEKATLVNEQRKQYNEDITDRKVDGYKKEKSAKMTAFDILRPYLLDNLYKEKTIDELTNIFDVKKTQMQEWLEKLLEDKYIIKLNRPIRYIKDMVKDEKA